MQCATKTCDKNMRQKHAMCDKNMQCATKICDKNMRQKHAMCDKKHAMCDKIALCKWAYLCDMRLLHAVAGKLKSSNFLAKACKSRMSHKRDFVVRGMLLSHRACKRTLTIRRLQMLVVCCVPPDNG